MNKKSSVITVDYYSDVLCVWAWIAQPRLEKLQEQWGERVRVRHRYVDIFGDAHEKILQKWGINDGFQEFHQHIIQSASDFEAAVIHPDTWARTQPRSSMQAHLVLKAAELVGGTAQLEVLALLIRQAFFLRGEDIADLDLLVSMTAGLDIDAQEFRDALRNGAAMAALSQDLRNAITSGVRGSPTWVLNEGRQVLYGNVGYRILSANIEELLANPKDETSWC